MTEQDSKVDDFVDNLPAKYIYDRIYDDQYCDHLHRLIEQSGLPKEDFLSNEKFQDFVLARMAATSVYDDISLPVDNELIIRPMIVKSDRFAEKYLKLLEHTGRNWGKEYMHYISHVADLATLAYDRYIREGAFDLLKEYIGEANVIDNLEAVHIQDLKDKDLFMKLAEKQLEAGIDSKSEEYFFHLDANGLTNLYKFVEKFPEYKEKVGLLVKKAADNDLIYYDRYDETKMTKVRHMTEVLIGDIPAARLAKIRKRVAGAVGLENVKMPFKEFERDVSQMIFEKKAKKNGKNA